MPNNHERLTELFAEAMDLDPGARRSMLAQLAASEPALANELAALLDEDAKIVTALRTAGLKPSDLASGVHTIPPVAPTTLSIPNYNILEKLGAGGMGIVYAAEQIDPPLPVAIKVLHSTTPEARARFAAEARIMRTLDHPGIARVFGTGDTADRPYIVMERIQGVNLDAYVRDRQPSLRARLELVLSICDAVHHAHASHIVHRDLKPANIMVRDDGTIAVLDFGVARAGLATGATRPGDMLGTPLYMSPEQAMGRPEAADARTDVYAIGVILFELVANAPPFDLRGLSLPAAIRKIIQHPPPPLGHDDVLDAVVARALAKKPLDRPASAAALGGELRRYLGRLPA